jgi:Double zinc ribbon
MPICEKCQTSCDEWQHFCLQCGHYLKVGPPPLLRCPGCGTEVSLNQKFCPECAVPLKDDASRPSRLIYHWKWLTGGLFAALMSLGLVLVLHLNRRPSPPPVHMVESMVPPPKMEEKPAISGETDVKSPTIAVSSLQAEVEQVFNRIKEANLKKNILMYMNTLAVIYPQANKKRQEVLKTWEKFEFKEMAFTVNKLQEVDSDNAIAEVKWTITSQNLKTTNLRADDFQYRVWFTKELGQWKIKKIEEL